MAVVVASTTMEGIAGVFYLQSITNTAFEYSLVLAMWAVGALIASIFYGRGWYKPQLVNAIFVGWILYRRRRFCWKGWWRILGL